MKQSTYILLSIVLTAGICSAQEQVNPSLSSGFLLMRKNNNISVEAEFGAGHLITLSSEYKINRLGAGVSLAFDTAKYTFLESSFREYLYNTSGLISYNVNFTKDPEILLEAYSRIGYELYSLSDYTDHEFFFGPGIKAGYKFAFVDFAFPVLFGTGKPITAFQIGAGLRYVFELKK